MKKISVLAIIALLLAGHSACAESQLGVQPSLSVEYSALPQATPVMRCGGDECPHRVRASNAVCPVALKVKVFLTLIPESNYSVQSFSADQFNIRVSNNGKFIGNYLVNINSNFSYLQLGKNFIGEINIPVCNDAVKNPGEWALTFGNEYSIDVFSPFSSPLVYMIRNEDVVTIPQLDSVMKSKLLKLVPGGIWSRAEPN
ncbi:MAG: hypothetical protein WCI27_01310 [Candidatus Omnitrophota bacterium]